MLFDVNRVEQNKIRASETRSSNFLLKRIHSDIENRILELSKDWEYGLIEGCKRNDLKELSKNDKITISEFSHSLGEISSIDLYVNLMQLHWSNDPSSDLSSKIKLLKPKGQFLCCLFGADTLKELRASFSKAEMNMFGSTSPRVSPFPEIRDVGNLAAKVGLNNLVVDRDIITVDYKRTLDLFLDIKKMGETNAILERRKSLTTKKLFEEVEKIYFADFSENTPSESSQTIKATFEVIFLYAVK